MPFVSSCNIQISFTYPDSSGNAHLLKTIQHIFVENLFGNSFSHLPPKQAMEEYVKQYIQEFKLFESSFDSKTSIEEENEYEDETGYSYYTKLKNNLLFNQNGFISFTVESLSYEGGAHTSKNIQGYVIDLATGELIQEDQFAGDNYKANISDLLAKKIATANDINDPKELENLGYNSLTDIIPNNNFTIDRNGITYYFNENEIAGTMVGITQVFIPYEELKIYINENSPFTLLWN